MNSSSGDLAEVALEFAPGEGDRSDHFIDPYRIAGVAIDKTGTITEGTFSITGFKVVSDTIVKKGILKLISSLEQQANHPIADALCKYCEASPEAAGYFNKVIDFENVQGEGVKGKVDGIFDTWYVQIGNRRMAEKAC